MTQQKPNEPQRQRTNSMTPPQGSSYSPFMMLEQTQHQIRDYLNRSLADWDEQGLILRGSDTGAVTVNQFGIPVHPLAIPKQEWDAKTPEEKNQVRMKNLQRHQVAQYPGTFAAAETTDVQKTLKILGEAPRISHVLISKAKADIEALVVGHHVHGQPPISPANLIQKLSQMIGAVHRDLALVDYFSERILTGDTQPGEVIAWLPQTIARLVGVDTPFLSRSPKGALNYWREELAPALSKWDKYTHNWLSTILHKFDESEVAQPLASEYRREVHEGLSEFHEDMSEDFDWLKFQELLLFLQSQYPQ